MRECRVHAGAVVEEGVVGAEGLLLFLAGVTPAVGRVGDGGISAAGQEQNGVD